MHINKNVSGFEKNDILKMSITKDRGFVVGLLAIFLPIILANLDVSLFDEERRDLLAALHKTCVDQIGISEGQIDKLKSAEFEDVNEKSKCYVKCLMSESGVMDENGFIDLAAFTEIVPEKVRESAKNTLETCLHSLDGAIDNCDKAFQLVQCNYKNDPDNYFLV